MSILGACIIVSTLFFAVYSVVFNRVEKFRWYVFLAMILADLFIGIGYVTDIGIVLTYDKFFEYIFIIVSICIFYMKPLELDPKLVLFGLIFIIICLFGLFNLSTNSNMPIVMPSTGFDALATGIRDDRTVAEFSGHNRSALISLILFVITVFLSSDYLRSKDKIYAFLKVLKNAFHIYFIILIIELLMNNFIDDELFRNTVLNIFGVTEDEESISRYIYRNGIMGAAAFFPETSYIAIVLIYYLMEFLFGINSTKDVGIHYLSMLLLTLSGSTSGIYLLPIAVLISVKEIFYKKHIIQHIGILFSISAGMLYLTLQYWDVATFLFETVQFKLISYLSGTDMGAYMSASGAARGLGNQSAYDIFMEAPFLGVGIGTTWAYGIIPTALECLGILGVISYVVFFKKAFNIRYSRKLLLAVCIFALYATGFYAGSDLFKPFIFSVGLIFSKYIQGIYL